MKAIILAAGRNGGNASARPMLLEPLGERRVLNRVVELVCEIVPRDQIIIVVGHERERVQEVLGPGFCYAVQEQQKGTGHAVLQAQGLLRDHQGDLLILYGDTPLYRTDSLRGLINRHRLKRADLTLLTAVVSEAFPYGRILRDADGRIVDIVEETDASPRIKAIRELNIGAYVVRSEILFATLEKLTPSPGDGNLRLTDCVHQLIRSGLQVEGYQIYDEDEIQGINTPEDLLRAEFILKKRMLHPRRVEDELLIRFGTGGWRAIIGEGFTLNHVRRLCQALANEILRSGEEKRGVVVGYDRRFLSNRAAEAAVEVFAGNNIRAQLLPEPAPTPLITFATTLENAAYGLAFTASHNPPEWNGLKVFCTDGSLMADAETARIQEEANRLTAQDVVRVDMEPAKRLGMIRLTDHTNRYIDAIESFVDMKAIREAGLKVIIDPMYGVGKVTLEILLTEARCRVTTIHGRRDPLFGGRSPAPDLNALGMLMATVKEEGHHLGLATDGDADRIALVDEQGRYIPTNELLLLLYYHLHEIRKMRGGVVRNLSTTHMLDRLAARFGEPCRETRVGFKHIITAMQESDALLGGESSGGLTIRGHILGKDGILAAALVVEMMALAKVSVSCLLERLYKLIGRLWSEELSVPATPEMKIMIPRRLTENPPQQIGPFSVRALEAVDGIKYLLDDDGWLLLRFSGTEPLMRICAEADSQEKVSEIMELGKKLAELD